MQKIRNYFTVALVITCLFSLAVADAQQKGSDHGAGGKKKSSVESPAECKQCGMDRSAFNYSRAVVTYEDGSSSGTCSINCAHNDVGKNLAKKIKSIQVADYETKKLIDAKTAVWVVGGKKGGVMSPVAKWAFAKKRAAEKYVGEFGGRITVFDDAWKASAGS